jgi:hypothetical protein
MKMNYKEMMIMTKMIMITMIIENNRRSNNNNPQIAYSFESST